MDETEKYCGDCLCRVCARNVCVAPEHEFYGCLGCNSCTGVVEYESDCVNSYGFEPADGDMAENELLPCPFCGGEAELVHWTNQLSWNTNYGIQCTTCKIMIDSAHSYFHTAEEAITAWNRRV